MLRWMLMGLFLRFALQAQVPFHRAFTTADGLASNLVYCALQDHEGFMWFATDAGVSRFDGLEFMNLGPADGLSDNEVLALFQDSKHRIWFLTLNGRLSYWLDGVIHTEATDPDLGKYTAKAGWTNACEDRDGYLWFSGIYGELVRLDLEGDDDQAIPGIGGRRNILIDARNEVVSVDGGIVGAMREGVWKPMGQQPAGGFLGHITSTVPEGMNGLGLSSEGIYDISSSGVARLNVDVRIDVVEHRSLERDHKGNIWLYRKVPGVQFIRREGQGYATPEMQFPEMKVNTVFVTELQERWYCTASSGVLLVSGQLDGDTEWYPTGRAAGSALISLGEGPGWQWVGSDLGSIFAYASGVFEKRFDTQNASRFGRVLRIATGADGVTWFGTDWGLFRHADGSSIPPVNVPAHFLHPKEVYSTTTPAKSVLVTRSGAVLASSMGLWSVKERQGAYVRERLHDGRIPSTRINCLAEDEKGRIWLETDQRIFGIEGDSVWSYAAHGASANSKITAIQAWSPDTLALATAGNGVLLWSRGELLGPIDAQARDRSLMVRNMRLRGDTLYCATNKGMLVYLRAGSGARLSWRWSATEGLPTDDVRDVLPVGGRVLMATAAGLCVAPERPRMLNGAIDNLTVVRFLVNDSVHHVSTQPVRMKLGDRLLVEVHAVEYTHAQEVEYVYSIDGGAEYPCERGRVVLDQLDEGTHTITMRARLGAAPWSPGKVIRVSVHPPWWASRAARLGAFLCGVALLMFALYYWSRRGFRRQLERVRAQAAVTEERQRIAADVHDDLGADISRVLMGLRMADPADATARAKAIAEADRGLSAAMQHMDEIIWSLDPQRDTLQATANFIETYTTDFAAQHQLEVTTDVRVGAGAAHLSAHARREIFLVVREALRNVAQHAKASHVSVSAVSEDGVLRVEITDDGVGLGASLGRREGRGLANMRKRVNNLGGSLTLEPGSTRGTRLIVRISLAGNPSIG